ncbi:hypothetical protein [uncultured Aquimarina sp.]|nr:hypothetical protein [uncultured Aquimarina sp.]
MHLTLDKDTIEMEIARYLPNTIRGFLPKTPLEMLFIIIVRNDMHQTL